MGEIIDADTSADAAPCTPASPALEICGNGIDEDCNNLVDDPALCDAAALIDVIEDPSGAALSSSDVFLHAQRGAGVGGILECRSGKVASNGTLSTTFAPCGSNRFSPSLDPGATGDGLYRTEFRIAHTEGVNSDALALSYYLHQTLEGATKCEPTVTPEELFTKALERLPVKVSDTGPTLTFSTESAVTAEGFAQLANPFIRINFTPRTSQAFGFGTPPTSTMLGRSDGLLKPLSLRRQFLFNADRSLVLITRRYVSRRGLQNCTVMGISQNVGESSQLVDLCDALVLNREGAGVCLGVSGTAISFLFNPPADNFSMLANTLLGETPLTDLVDNALWRKIGRVYSPTPATMAQRAACSGAGKSNCRDSGYSGRWGSRLFSPKCYGALSCTLALDAMTLVGNKFSSIYLPDDGLFRFE